LVLTSYCNHRTCHLTSIATSSYDDIGMAMGILNSTIHKKISLQQVGNQNDESSNDSDDDCALSKGK